MPTTRQVMANLGAVFQVASAMKMRLGITAALNTKELQRHFKNRVENRGVNMERCRGVVTHHHKVFTWSTRCKPRKIGSIKIFFFFTDRILTTELIHARYRIEGAVNPDIRLYHILLDQAKRTAPRLSTAIGVNHLELGHLRVGHIGILVILRPKATLVYSNGPTRKRIQRVEIPTAMHLVGAVQIRKFTCYGKIHGKEHQ